MSLVTYYTSALHEGNYGGLHSRRETLVRPICFFAGPAGFSATTYNYPAIAVGDLALLTEPRSHVTV